MTRRLVHVVLGLALLAGVTTLVQRQWGTVLSKTAYAIGDITIDWGVPAGDPIFTVPNMAPDDTESRTVTIENGASVPRPIGVRGTEDSVTGNLSSVLEVTISSNADLYGGASGTGTKTLADFFTESAGPEGVPLFILAPGESRNVTFTVVFPASAGNEFQNGSVQFDLIVGIAIRTPSECSGLTIGGLPIVGTDRGDRLIGTPQNDLIVGLESGDRVEGNGGDDCIIGNEGSDGLWGGEGNDIILGEDGQDSLRGGNGNDHLVGGNGSDALRGEGGDDELHGNNGSDSLRGDGGVDALFGEDGSDALRGGADGDTLIGGAQSDSANGNGGVDTCEAESELNCEL